MKLFLRFSFHSSRRTSFSIHSSGAGSACRAIVMPQALVNKIAEAMYLISNSEAINNCFNHVWTNAPVLDTSCWKSLFLRFPAQNELAARLAKARLLVWFYFFFPGEKVEILSETHHPPRFRQYYDLKLNSLWHQISRQIRKHEDFLTFFLHLFQKMCCYYSEQSFQKSNKKGLTG